MVEVAVQERSERSVTDIGSEADRVVGPAESSDREIETDDTIGKVQIFAEGLAIEDVGIMTEWLIEDPTSLRGMGLVPGLSISQVHARLVKIAQSGDNFWLSGRINQEGDNLVGIGWFPKSTLVNAPVVSLLTSPQHRKKWAHAFGVAGMKFIFETFGVQRIIATVPVTLTSSRIRRLLKDNGGHLASYGYQKRMGFEYMQGLPMLLERENFKWVS